MGNYKIFCYTKPTKMNILTLVFVNDTSEKRTEITDRPKLFKHLKMVARRIFGSAALDCNYVLSYKDEKIPLKDPDTNLMKYYANNTPIEVHLNLKNDMEDYLNIQADDWTMIGGSFSVSNLEKKSSNI